MSPRIGEDRALVLRRFAFAETSLIVHLLTRQHGLVHGIAKGAYRPRSRLYGWIDLFDTLSVGWSTSRGGGLVLIRDGGIDTRRRGVTRDLDRYRAGLGILELAALGARAGRPEKRLFDLCASHLDALDREIAAPRLVALSFQLSFLEHMGLQPRLEACVGCDQADLLQGSEKGLAFSDSAGGALCPACARSARAEGTQVRRVTRAAVRGAIGISRVAPDALDRTSLADALVTQVDGLVRGFLEYHLESRARAFSDLSESTSPERPRRSRPRKAPR